MSEAVAAFFVGMAFSPTRYVRELEATLSPLRDMFAAVFFFWIGVITDPVLFLDVLGIIGIAVIVTSISKIVSGYYSGLVYNLEERRSLRVGLSLVIRGEFSLVIGATALLVTEAVMSQTTVLQIYSFTVGYVLVMSVLGTILMQATGVIEHRVFPLEQI